MKKRNQGESKSEEHLFSANDMAKALDLTPRRVQQLANEGILVKASRGKYLAVESVRNYLQYQQEGTYSGTEVDLQEERALHERAKREKAELIVAVMKGDLHRSRDVEIVLNDMVASFRSRILALPTKLAPQLISKIELAEIKDILTKEVSEALTELSEYDPQVFYSNNEDYVELNDDED